MLVCIVFLLVISIYCTTATVFNLPQFRTTKFTNGFFSNKKSHKYGIKSTILMLSRYIEPFIRLNKIKESKLQKALVSADEHCTPRQYMASVYIYTAFFILLGLLLLLVNTIVALFTFAMAIFMYTIQKNEVFKASDKRKYAIEQELPRFTSYLTGAMKTNRNLTEIIATYNKNFRSELTIELSKTLADMNTGNAERALQRLETRVNSSLLSEVVRGLISFLRGDNMRDYFDNLTNKLQAFWRQRLREQAVQVEPKITRLSYFLTASALGSIFYVMFNLLMQTKF